MTTFETTLKAYEIEEGVEVDLTVTGTAETLEDLRITNERGTPLPENVQDDLRDSRRFLDTMERQLERDRREQVVMVTAEMADRRRLREVENRWWGIGGTVNA